MAISRVRGLTGKGRAGRPVGLRAFFLVLHFEDEHPHVGSNGDFWGVGKERKSGRHRQPSMEYAAGSRGTFHRQALPGNSPGIRISWHF
jgi:hypothetical protein